MWFANSTEVPYDDDMFKLKYFLFCKKFNIRLLSKGIVLYVCVSTCVEMVNKLLFVL